MSESSTFFSERKIVYCEIIGGKCIQEGGMYHMEDIIIPVCNSCGIYRNRNKIKTRTMDDFRVGEKVETTPEFKEESGLYITGKVEGSSFNYIDIVTDNGTHFSVRIELVREVSQ